MPDHPFIAPPNDSLTQATTLLSTGIQMWDQNRKTQSEEQRRRQDQEAGLLAKGLLVDPETNQVKRDANSEAQYKLDQAHNDPLSQQSVAARNVAKAFLPPSQAKTITDDLTGNQALGYLKQLKPEVSGVYGLIGKEKMLDAQNEIRAEKERLRTEKEALLQSPEGRLKHLNGTEKTRFDNVTMGLGALKQLDDAMKEGTSRVSLIGDNPFTVARGQWEEAIGRMQSGGAINKDEEKRFRALIPTATDDEQTSQTKMQTMKGLMTQRLRTLGFKPEDLSALGMEPGKLGLLQKEGALSPEDQEAITWAKKNPNDPLAAEIFKLHGM